MLNVDATREVAAVSDGCLVVTTMTTIFTWPNDAPTAPIRCAPLMGGASSIGLGLALARPDTPVLVLDGDGSLIMQLGALTTIAGAAPPNLVHFVFDNGVLYEGGGRLPVANARNVDFVSLAAAAGYPRTRSIDSLDELREALPGLLEPRDLTLVRLDVDIPPTPRWSQRNPPAELPDWWFTMLAEDSRRVRAQLLGDS